VNTAVMQTQTIPVPERAAAFEARCRAAMRLALTDVEACTQEAAALLHEAGQEPGLRAWALIVTGHAAAFRGELNESVRTLEQAEALSAAAGPSCGALAASALVQPLMRLGMAEVACAAARRAAAASRASGDDLATARALVGLGAAERAAGRLSDAVRALDEAERLGASNAVVSAAAASNRAECLLDAERFGEAAQAFEQAAGRFESAGRGHAAAISLGNLADTLGRVGRVDEALIAFERARRIFESGGAALDAARLSCEEAEMLARAGALRAARDRYAGAIPTLVRADSTSDVARARLGLSEVLVELGDAGSAASNVELASQLGPDDPRVVLCRARCALASQRPADAAALARAAASGAGSERPAFAASAALVESRALLAAGDAIGAALAARSARDAARRAGIRTLGPLCEQAIAECSGVIGARDVARAALGRAQTEAAGILHATESRAARAGLARLFRPIFDAYASVLCAAGDPGAADAVLAAASVGVDTPSAHPTPSAPAARLGGERGSESGTEPSTESGVLAAQLAAVTERIGRASAAAGAFPTGTDPTHLDELHARASVLRDRLAVLARGSGTPAASATPAARTGTVASLAAALGPRDVGLHFFTEDGRVSCLVLGATGPRIVRDGVPLSTLNALARKAAFLAEPSEDTPTLTARWTELAASIGRSLLGPAGLLSESGHMQPGVRQLLVSGHATAGTLPWGAVARAVRAAGQAAPCVVLGGAAPRLFTARRAVIAAPAAAVLAADLADLPGARAEAAAVGRVWAGATAMVGGSAAEQLGLIAAADVVHLATHGVLVPDRPGASRLWLGDAWVPMLEIARALRPGAVVVLSVCHAGREAAYAEDRAALPEALLAAGAAAVIAPIWPVRDDTAADFFASLHARLRAHAASTPLHAAARAAWADLIGADRPPPDLDGVILFGGVGC
jgi:tetratricopeptide (TPR) repeat protein